MTVRDLYNRLQELPLDRFDDEVFLYVPDGERYQLDILDESIEGIVELNGKDHTVINEDIPGFEGLIDKLRKL